MAKKVFKSLEMEILSLDEEDVICTSGAFEIEDSTDPTTGGGNGGTNTDIYN